MKAAIVYNNVIVNVIEYDPEENYEPETGQSLLTLGDDDIAGPGWILVDGRPQPPEETPSPEPEPSREQKRITALEAAVDQLILDQLMGA